METLAIGVIGFGIGITRYYGKQVRLICMNAKDKALLTIAILVLVSCFTLIAFSKSTTECFGLIGLVVGHFFGREMGKNERSTDCK
jgi:uncharacterized membrane protein YkvI